MTWTSKPPWVSASNPPFPRLSNKILATQHNSALTDPPICIWWLWEGSDKLSHSKEVDRSCLILHWCFDQSACSWYPPHWLPQLPLPGSPSQQPPPGHPRFKSSKIQIPWTSVSWVDGSQTQWALTLSSCRTWCYRQWCLGEKSATLSCMTSVFECHFVGVRRPSISINTSKPSSASPA